MHVYTDITYVNCFLIYIHFVFYEIIQFKNFFLEVSVWKCKLNASGLLNRM